MRVYIGITIGIILLGSLAFFLFRPSSDLPTGETTKKTIVIDNGQVVDVVTETDVTGDVPIEQNDDPSFDTRTKEIFVTDGVRHSVPLNEILGGGPPKDGIPSIDDPKYVSIADADFITDDEPGIAVSLNGIDRFYPFQIMVWHEIVNDNFNGQEVLVTYCPLCLSGIVFDPLVAGERVEFGTSGKLWQSNLIMYDRKTDSYWSQVLGEAIVGEMTGTKLTVLPSDMTRFGEWKGLHPNGQVLSRDTGAIRFYGRDPYGDYYTDNGSIFFPVANSDDRLENKDLVLGLVINEQALAIDAQAAKAKGELRTTFEGKTIVATYEPEIEATRVFEILSDGTRERINPFPNFWFSWVAAHPETELLQ